MRNIKILIVEDDAFYRAFLVSALKGMGYDPVCAEDGIEALNILNTAPINFIISDCMMPQMDGVELCKEIRLARFGRYTYFIS